ncbi:TMEM175 family protein [Nocardia sp. NPDC056000]|uniref:TMEM175 family protein n=1 Tax=Nocardia sp. NPDC056000 TaxID=3345674 RepID=UPI0035DF9FBE
MNDSGRVEAFSDGVFAVAITLLILEIKVPANAGEHLWRELGHQWPSYAAYVVTFLVIGIMWVNHHTVFGFVERVDRVLLFLNLLLLLGVVALPWTAALVAEYLAEGHAEGAATLSGSRAAHTAVAVYGSFMVYHAIIFQALWMHLTKTGHLFDSRVDAEAARGTRLRFGLGLLIYPCTVALAFLSAPLTLALHGLLAVYYALNQIPVPVREGRTATNP